MLRAGFDTINFEAKSAKNPALELLTILAVFCALCHLQLSSGGAHGAVRACGVNDLSFPAAQFSVYIINMHIVYTILQYQRLV